MDLIIEQVAADDDEMQEVRLSGKGIVGDDGLTRLADALSSNSCVESLHLSNNDIGPEGVEALADCLYQNLHVERIDLSFNRIGNQGAIALARCLQRNHSVTSLDLRNNGIDGEGAASLLYFISKNTTLHNIDLEENDIPRSTLSEIDRALESKATEYISFSFPLESREEGREDDMSSDHRSGIFTFGTLDEEMPRYSSHQEGLPRYSSPAKKPSGFPMQSGPQSTGMRRVSTETSLFTLSNSRRSRRSNKSCREFVSAIKKKLKRVDLE
jgi:hypothetical protein